MQKNKKIINLGGIKIMADVQNKILNTRIQLKYDTYANWSTNNPTLLQGEIAIAILTDVTSQTGANAAGTTG
jgi:hypothetical protein